LLGEKKGGAKNFFWERKKIGIFFFQKIFMGGGRKMQIFFFRQKIFF